MSRSGKVLDDLIDADTPVHPSAKEAIRETFCTEDDAHLLECGAAKTKIPLDTIELTPELLENFKKMYAEVAERAKTHEPGQACRAGIVSPKLNVNGQLYGVQITIEIGKLEQQFNA